MKNILLALLSGFLLVLAWPTYGFPLLLLFAFIPLLYSEYKIRLQPHKHGGWKVFGLAYLSFFIWNIFTTFWLYYSTEAGMIFANLANTLLMALVFTIYHHLAKHLSSNFSLTFLAALWMCFEYLHLHWDFSWPWLNLGNGFSEFPQWIQWYEYTGTFGGTLWIWVTNIIGFKLLLGYQKTKKTSILYRQLTALVLLIVIPIGVSYIIWFTYPLPSDNSQNTVKTLILQPNIDPYQEKYNINDEQVGQLLKKMTLAHINDSTQLVLAPETVYADGTQRSKFKNSFAYRYSQDILNAYPKVSILAGISFYDYIHEQTNVGPQSNFIKPGLWFNGYNSAFLISSDHQDQIYDKSKLVVGVETFPYQQTLKPLLGDIMIDLGGTVAKLTTQDERGVFDFNSNDKTAPIICYESVYGQFVNDYVKNGAQFLSIITNDAWWKDTQGHKQHVSYARLRAIETRRDVAQSANTGTSAYINQKGEITAATKYGVQTVLEGIIHLNKAKTFYIKHGDYIAHLAEYIALLLFVLGIYKKISSKKNQHKTARL